MGRLPGGGNSNSSIKHIGLTYLHEAGQQDPEGDLEGRPHMCVVNAQDWKGLSRLHAMFSDGMVNRVALWMVRCLRWGSGDIPNRAFPWRFRAGGRAELEAMAPENR